MIRGLAGLTLLAALLLACRSSEPASGAPAKPAERAHQDDDTTGIVDHPAPGWDLARWFNSAPLTTEALRGKVVLVRWFMSPECPYCSATAPSLNLFHERYKDRGLVVVGMYHHKGKEPLDPDDVRRFVDHYRFQFPVAIDEDWRVLRKWWLDGHPDRQWTSVSFVLDKKSIVRHVHPGGKYAPDDPDYEKMRAVVEALLAEP